MYAYNNVLATVIHTTDSFSNSLTAVSFSLSHSLSFCASVRAYVCVYSCEESCIEKGIEAAIEKQVRTVGACAHICTRSSASSLRVSHRTNVHDSDNHCEDEEQMLPRRNPRTETKFLERVVSGMFRVRPQGAIVTYVNTSYIVNHKLL